LRLLLLLLLLEIRLFKKEIAPSKMLGVKLLQEIKFGWFLLLFGFLLGCASEVDTLLVEEIEGVNPPCFCPSS